MPINTFSNRLHTFRSLEVKQQEISNRISNLRMLVFLIGAGITSFCFVKTDSIYGYFVLLISLITFIHFVLKHQQIKRELNKIRCKIEINEKYLSRMDGSWINFKENGQEFIDPGHSYTGDLDIFGEKSLFQWINVAHTFYGRKTLKKFLATPEKDIRIIKRRQQGVKELTEKGNFVEELQCLGMLAADIENDPSSLIAYAENPSQLFQRKWLQNIFYILPVATVLSLILLLFEISIPTFIPLSLISVQMILTAIGFKENSLALNTVHKFKENLDAFNQFIALIEKEKFQDEYLSQLQSDLLHEAKAASLRVKHLERIVTASELRYNIISFSIMNFLMLWDFHCVFALEAWKKQNGNLIRSWLGIIGHFEALASIGVILQLHPKWSFPAFAEKGLLFSAVDMGHPLLVETKSVRNNIDMKNTICVITGSNMSGKTTLLRTIGINLVLAYCGAPVSASKLECSIMNIFTSMRINDDLNSGISTFYAELLRIKTIIDFSHQQEDMIFLIDEIFRGTNSRDRVLGAASVLKNLNKDWIIGLISTHDFELCNLEKDTHGKIVNYHFTESYVDNEIQFDYKLRIGQCTTTNAKYLMKMVGIELYE
ncbi:MutS family DNA mismatch repair protein [Pelosinus sp. UFO1]|uniref:MutS family DNA mismatch repair protein n=1 Tax=Pelosinus sp. UFO1 TaxID=484770 RepID=UPI0004D1A1B7|nr:MutS family DNA mismatch repair protein [Pelosinus sp. UFO1]AIF49705.1 DNA mismatch repair protein MutS domain protein [Pelosinus sp. UFO1]